jgi:hypothetical protein
MDNANNRPVPRANLQILFGRFLRTFPQPVIGRFHRFWGSRTIRVSVRMLPVGGGRCRRRSQTAARRTRRGPGLCRVGAAGHAGAGAEFCPSDMLHHLSSDHSRYTDLVSPYSLEAAHARTALRSTPAPSALALERRPPVPPPRRPGRPPPTAQTPQSAPAVAGRRPPLQVHVCREHQRLHRPGRTSAHLSHT